MGSKIAIELKFFGACREAVGLSSCRLEVAAPATAQSVVEEIKQRFHPLNQFKGPLLIALNEEYASRDQEVKDGDTVAIFPPVSGGSQEDIFEITREAISPEAIRARLLRGSAGAVVTFDGVARNNTKGRRTLFLEYEGYEPMAIKTMRRIGEEVRRQWDIDRIGIVHRLGRIEIGESSVVIVVTSAHRKIAFAACQYAIDRLKQIVPIWKREHFEDGAVWVEGQAPPELLE